MVVESTGAADALGDVKLSAEADNDINNTIIKVKSFVFIVVFVKVNVSSDNLIIVFEY